MNLQYARNRRENPWERINEFTESELPLYHEYRQAREAVATKASTQSKTINTVTFGSVEVSFYQLDDAPVTSFPSPNLRGCIRDDV